METPARPPWYEAEQTANGWEFRPNRRATRRFAYFAGALLGVVAALILFPLAVLGVGCVSGLFVKPLLIEEWLQWPRSMLALGATLILLITIGRIARIGFRKSFAKEWQTLVVHPGGPITLGEKMLLEPGRAHRVSVRRRLDHSAESTTEIYEVIVFPNFESLTEVEIPVPTARTGVWQYQFDNELYPRLFALHLATALGVPLQPSGEIQRG